MEILDPSNHFGKVTNCRATMYSCISVYCTILGDALGNTSVNEVFV